MRKDFYVFRHGETDMNAAGQFQGQTVDAPLNEKGRAQAEKLAETLKNSGMEIVFSSPLKRAFETAGTVAKALNIPLKTDRHFIEGNLGVIERRKKETLTQDERTIFSQWAKLDNQFQDVHFQGGESKRQILNRTISGLKGLLSQPYQKIGIATHSAVLRFLLLYLGKKQHDIPNGTVFHIVYEDRRFYLADKEKILLLSCCAPCSCAVIKTMAEARQDFSVVFYNPNIRPLAEYEKRRDENKRVCELYQVPFIELEYDNDRWCDITKGLENEPERGKRCSLCFHMRLKRVMEYAKENGFTAVASVLGVSRYKNLDQVNDMAERAAKETKFPYLEIEGRKNGMQELRAQLIKELELYQQTYCGCKPR